MDLGNLINENNSLDLSKSVCHSGGAQGADFFFEKMCKKYNIEIRAYSYKTEYHHSANKVEISDEDYDEGVQEIKKANVYLKRKNINKYMNLFARNWAQVKYSNQIFAVGNIVDPEKKGSIYYNKSKYQIIEGGTGHCIMMSILNGKPIYVFEQKENKWFEWSYITNKYKPCLKLPVISDLNFAGVGTRDINENGIKAIKNLFKRSFS